MLGPGWLFLLGFWALFCDEVRNEIDSRERKHNLSMSEILCDEAVLVS